MKRILLILLIFISLNCFSQTTAVRPTEATGGPGWLYSTPGEELRKASICHFTGLGCELGGFVLITVGLVKASAYSSTNNNNSTAGSGDVLSGTLLLITGGVLNVLAWVHIGHAGKLMDMNKVSFGTTKNGIGLAYSL